MILDGATSVLALIDLQERLMPAIAGAGDVVANARRLALAADLLGVPAIVTEQNPKGLGRTTPHIPVAGLPLVEKTSFDSCGAPAFLAALPAAGSTIVLAGCEAHVCVLQTALGLVARGRRVALVADAIGSRREENRMAALSRAAAAGVEIVSTEMVLFEWLGSSDHPRFRAVLDLVR